MKTFEEVYETLPGTGWLSEDEAWVLWGYVNRTTGPILEVGCYHGRSTVLLASTGRPVYAVDPFAGFDDGDPTGEAARRAFLVNVESRNLGDLVTLFRERVEDWEPRPCGFAYIDGDHTYAGTVAQVEKAVETGARVIGVHDVNDSGGGLEVKRAAVELLGPWSFREGRLAVWEL